MTFPVSRPHRLRSSASSATARDRSRALRTETMTRSRASGFSKKSKAPSRVAFTASVTVAWPEIMMIGT